MAEGAIVQGWTASDLATSAQQPSGGGRVKFSEVVIARLAVAPRRQQRNHR
jgi:hypothetical protein